MKKNIFVISVMALGFTLFLLNLKSPPLKTNQPKSAAFQPAASFFSQPTLSVTSPVTPQDAVNTSSFNELEQISQELIAFQKRVGDDPTKMTNKELEESVQLFKAYNEQLESVLNQYEKGIL